MADMENVKKNGRKKHGADAQADAPDTPSDAGAAAGAPPDEPVHAAGGDVPPIPPAFVDKAESRGKDTPASSVRAIGGAVLLGVALAFLLIGAAIALVVFEPRVNAEARRLLGAGDAAERAALAERLGALDRRVDQILSRIESLPPAADPARVATLENRLDALRTGIESLPPRVDPERIDALESAVRARPAPVNPERIDALDQRLAGLSSRLDRLSGKDDVPRALALLMLERRLETGRPFAALFDRARPALAAAGAQTEDLDALAPYAGRGVPTATSLAAAARALPLTAAAPPAAPDAPAPDAGLWDRIKSSLGSLVTVRRVGEGAPSGARPTADPHSAAVAAFAAGDVDAGLAALRRTDPAALPPEAARALEALRADARARLAADRLIGAIDSALGPAAP